MTFRPDFRIPVAIERIDESADDGREDFDMVSGLAGATGHILAWFAIPVNREGEEMCFLYMSCEFFYTRIELYRSHARFPVKRGCLSCAATWTMAD